MFTELVIWSVGFHHGCGRERERDWVTTTVVKVKVRKKMVARFWPMVAETVWFIDGDGSKGFYGDGQWCPLVVLFGYGGQP